MIEHSLWIHRKFNRRMLLQCFHFRSKSKMIFIVKVVQWFNSKMIARNKSLLFISVVNYKGEHSSDSRQHINPFLFIQVHEHL